MRHSRVHLRAVYSAQNQHFDALRLANATKLHFSTHKFKYMCFRFELATQHSSNFWDTAILLHESPPIRNCGSWLNCSLCFVLQVFFASSLCQAGRNSFDWSSAILCFLLSKSVYLSNNFLVFLWLWFGSISFLSLEILRRYKWWKLFWVDLFINNYYGPCWFRVDW